jgi:hypothetical protein
MQAKTHGLAASNLDVILFGYFYPIVTLPCLALCGYFALKILLNDDNELVEYAGYNDLLSNYDPLVIESPSEAATSCTLSLSYPGAGRYISG